MKTGAFQRASFEQTADVLLDAGQFAEVNDLRGVTERIMLGMVCQLGTGAFELVLDHEALQQAMEVCVAPRHLADAAALSSCRRCSCTPTAQAPSRSRLPDRARPSASRLRPA